MSKNISNLIAGDWRLDIIVNDDGHLRILSKHTSGTPVYDVGGEPGKETEHDVQLTCSAIEAEYVAETEGEFLRFIVRTGHGPIGVLVCRNGGQTLEMYQEMQQDAMIAFPSVTPNNMICTTVSRIGNRPELVGHAVLLIDVPELPITPGWEETTVSKIGFCWRL